MSIRTSISYFFLNALRAGPRPVVRVKELMAILVALTYSRTAKLLWGTTRATWSTVGTDFSEGGATGGSVGGASVVVELVKNAALPGNHRIIVIFV